MSYEQSFDVRLYLSGAPRADLRLIDGVDSSPLSGRSEAAKQNMLCGEKSSVFSRVAIHKSGCSPLFFSDSSPPVHLSIHFLFVFVTATWNSAGTTYSVICDQ